MGRATQDAGREDGAGTAKRATIAGTLLLVVASLCVFAIACCPRTVVNLGAAHRLPPPGQIALPAPAEVASASDTLTEAVMRNVLFHVDDDALLGVRSLRGVFRDLRGRHIILLDDKYTIEIEMHAAEIALTPRDLSILLNRYIFGFKGSPLKNMNVRIEGDHIVQTGTMHKIIDIPFEMTATLGVSPDGWIRIHPTKIKICSLDGEKLLQAVGSSLEKLLDVSGGKGIRVKGNDLFIDPLASLPAPRITGRLTSIRVEAGAIVQDFIAAGATGGSALTSAAASATAAVAADDADDADTPGIEPSTPAPNFVYFRGGTVQFGKLYMVKTDLEVIDGDMSDPFDFYLDYYNTQLVNGYHVSTKDFGLVAYMPDFDDLGTPRGNLH